MEYIVTIAICLIIIVVGTIWAVKRVVYLENELAESERRCMIEKNAGQDYAKRCRSHAAEIDALLAIATIDANRKLKEQCDLLSSSLEKREERIAVLERIISERIKA